MAANKTDLANGVQELLGEIGIELNKKDTGKVVDAVLDTIIGLTGEAGKLQLIGFGSFEIRERAARKGQNPSLLKQLKEQGVSAEDAKEQSQIDIAPSTTVGFKVGKQFKDFIQ